MIIRKSSIGIFLTTYIASVAYGFYLLFAARTGGAITSPWQTIAPRYVVVFFLATAILGSLIFLRLKTSIILFFLILHSLLLHSYLPLTHQLLYGADQWRHMAVETRIASGLPFLTPTLANGQTGSFINNFVGRVGYSNLWYLSAGLSFFKLSLLDINKWLVPILWSIFFPLLFYTLLKQTGWFEKRTALVIVWLSALPFTWQVNGSLTLPVSLGFLFFLGALILLIVHFQTNSKIHLVWIALAEIILLFNYPLYAVLFFIFWLSGELLFYRKVIISAGVKKVVTGLIWLFVALSIPTVELVAGYSTLKQPMSFLKSTVHVISTFLALPLAKGPPPNDTLEGNIIFNQIPRVAFVPNIFTNWRSWIPVFLLAFWLAVFYGGKKLIKTGWLGSWWVLCGSAGLFGYILSRYFLVGEQVLSRRLDSTIALFAIVLCGKALADWLNSQKMNVPIIKVLIVGIFSIAIAASYSLGPDTNAVSLDEYHAMQYVWQQEKNETKHCVIADTYPLLALEAISARQIIGGGFPINSTFAQPERSALFSWALGNNIDWLSAHSLTGAQNCWLVVGNKKQYINNNEQPCGLFKNFGGTIVWREGSCK